MSEPDRSKLHEDNIVQTEKDEDDDLDSFDALGAPEAEANVFVPEPVAFSSELAALVSPSIEEKARVSQPPSPSEEDEARIDLSRVAGVAPPPPASGSVPPPPSAAAVPATSPASTPPVPIASPVSSPPAAGGKAAGSSSRPPASAASGTFPVGTADASTASPRDLFASPLPAAPAAPQAPASVPPKGLDDDLEALVASRSFGPSAAFTGAAKTLVASVARTPRWAWVAIGGFVGGVIMTALFLGGEEPDPSATTATVATQTAPAVSVVGPEKSGSTGPGSIDSRGAGEQGYGSRRDGSRYGASDRYRRRGARRRTTDRGGDRDRTMGAGSTPEPSSGGDRSIDSLLDSALGTGSASESTAASGTAGKNRSTASSGTGLSLMPSRQEVSQAMSDVLPDVRRCAGGRSGVVTADVTVRGNGLVSRARIRGAPFARTPAGRCMERAIRSARFPRFRKSVFRVTYPFRI
jgi:hypothetical protein